MRKQTFDCPPLAGAFNTYQASTLQGAQSSQSAWKRGLTHGLTVASSFNEGENYRKPLCE